MLDASSHAPPRGWLSRALARLTPAPAATLPTPPAAKASRTGPLIAFEGLREPVWSPRDYAAFAREGMMQNAIVYRAVRMVAEAAASVPLLLYDGDVEIEAHPLLDLLARPNPVSTRPDLLEAWYGALLVSGNAYLEAVATGGEIRELHALRADRMKVIPGPDGWPEGYEYTANGESIRFVADVVEGVRPILHLKFFHPANDHYGLSPLEAAATAIDIHNTASRWNKALLDNSARPSGALVYTARDGNLSPDQFERLKSELEAGFQGAAHAGRPMLLEGGLDWKSMSLSPKDMDFIEAKHVAAREIALALGVPPMLLGIPGDNTYSNYQEATRSLWRQTVLPLVTRTAKALSAWLSPAWNESLDLRPDLDAIDALSSERDALWSRLEKTTFLTPDEKRAAIGYAPLDAGGRKYNHRHDDRGRFDFKPPGEEEAGREITFTVGTGPRPADARDAIGPRDDAGETANVILAADRGQGFDVDLLEEEARGGHPVSEHVAKSEEKLQRRVEAEASKAMQKGDRFRGFAAGSFYSLQSANRLVNATLSSNSEIANKVGSGELPFAIVEQHFNSPTGYEVYLDRLHAQPYQRTTYGVRLFLLRDPQSPRGFRVQSAFPVQ